MRIVARDGDWGICRCSNWRYLPSSGSARQQALKYFHELAPCLENLQLAAGRSKSVAEVRRRYASVMAANGDESGAAIQRTNATASEAAIAGSSKKSGTEVPPRGYSRRRGESGHQKR